VRVTETREELIRRNVELDELHAELDDIERHKARNSLAVYCGLMQPELIEREDDLDDLKGMHKLSLPARYVPAAHHRLLISKLEDLERGYVEVDGERVPFKRLMVFMPPGSAKSTYGSVLFPSWYLGKHPTHDLIQGSYNGDLADRFGRRARNMFASPDHYAVFGVGLSAGSKAMGEWTTEHGGEYFAFGMKTGVTGRRANGAIIDDAIKGRKEADSKTERDNVWETYRGDVRTRLKPGGWILYIATRWHEDDPAGRILPPEALGKSGWYTAKDGEKWYVLSLAAVVETQEEADHDPLGREIGECLWPEWFSPEHFAQEKATQGSRNWNALFQQKPRPDEGAILKKAWWRKWPSSKAPKCEFVLSIYDTAFEEGEDDDYTARTSWGIFWSEEALPEKGGAAPTRPGARGVKGRYSAILLERLKKRLNFPDLRREAQDHYDLYQPDVVMVEKKASGHSLLQELRRAKVPVRAIKADKSKLARANAAAVVFEQGCIFYMDRDWAREVIDECAAATFKKGDPGNDIPDTVVHMANYLRRTYHLQLPEEVDEDEVFESRNEERKSQLFRFV
jgi:predicted phage terminase large subunit-like protein